MSRQGALQLWCDRSTTAVSIGIYRPRPGHSLDDLLLCLHKTLSSIRRTKTGRKLLRSFALLRALTNGSWAAAFMVIQKSEDWEDHEQLVIQEMEACLKREISPVAATLIDCGLYELSCGECKEGGSSARLCKGEAVHLRWLQMRSSSTATAVSNGLAETTYPLDRQDGDHAISRLDLRRSRVRRSLSVERHGQSCTDDHHHPIRTGAGAAPCCRQRGAMIRARSKDVDHEDLCAAPAADHQQQQCQLLRRSASRSTSRSAAAAANRAQELLSYSCVAVLKAYLKQIEGLRSCTFYSAIISKHSLAPSVPAASSSSSSSSYCSSSSSSSSSSGGDDQRRHCEEVLEEEEEEEESWIMMRWSSPSAGTRRRSRIRMVGVGVWESAQAACSFIGSPRGSPAEPFWRSLGAELRCGVCEVVYVSC